MRLLPLAVALAVFACDPPKPPPGDADAGAPDGSIELPDTLVYVSGSGEAHPEAKRYLQARSLAVPAPAGWTARLEEPLLAQLGDPDAGFGGTAVLGANGGYTVGPAPASQVTVGLSVRIEDGADGGVLLPAWFDAFNVAAAGGRPSVDVQGVRTFALPIAFYDALNAAIGETSIRSATGNAAGTLREAGFALGYVVGPNGERIPNAKVQLDPPSAAAVFYPRDDLSGSASVATDLNGLFVLVHPSSAVTTFTLRLEDRGDYAARKVALALGGAVILYLYPGTKAP